uniref:putative HVA22-like protein g isoform X2 n=1 Tax=Erigeron canadensis TaxID=72917 RepID=UPI001CB9C1CC|nr:putative HVA22-like protein g isoform X2 [Erigeron canadensis]
MLGDLLINSLVVIIAILTVFERIGNIFISWVPMYGELKLALIIYLWYPKTKGTGYVYNAMLRPFIARHETDIERSLREMRAKAWDVAIYYWHNSSELGQTRIFEIFRLLASNPSRPRSEVLHNYQNERRPPPPPPPPPPTPPPATPPVVPRQDHVEDTWVPTAPPMPSISHRQPVYPEELHVPESPSGSRSNSGQREPVWLRFKKSRGL